MINWFEVKEPMIYGQGSFGTVSGEGPSASRYTECYLSPFGLECVCGALTTNNEVVDWNPTYDNKHMEPQYLPVKVPLLLINGILGGIGTIAFSYVDLIVMIATALMLFVFSRNDYKISRREGICFLLVFVVYYGYVMFG